MKSLTAIQHMNPVCLPAAGLQTDMLCCQAANPSQKWVKIAKCPVVIQRGNPGKKPRISNSGEMLNLQPQLRAQLTSSIKTAMAQNHMVKRSCASKTCPQPLLNLEDSATRSTRKGIAPEGFTHKIPAAQVTVIPAVQISASPAVQTTASAVKSP